MIYVEDLLRLALAIFIGGLIGAEREFRDKTAGLRTLMFICAGSTLFTIFSMRIVASTGGPSDPMRIAAQIVSGIGFLGAGAIIRNDGEIQGLTTASTIWLVAALGLGIGGGQYLFAIFAALIILMVLILFPSVEYRMEKMHKINTYRIVCVYHQDKIKSLQNFFSESGLRIISKRNCRRGNEITCTWRAIGGMASHQTIVDNLLADPEIHEFEY